MRACILPYPCDPFQLRYWLSLFKKYWYDEIDKLYIVANSEIESEVVDYIRWITTDPKIELLYTNRQIQHGDAINWALDGVREEYLMLIEDDCFIFHKGSVDFCFEWLENGSFDIVASKRGSCSQEISDMASKKWGLNYYGLGDQGCNFWPNLFFSRADLLRTTDRNFNARAWRRGETVIPIEYDVDVAEVVGDTFVNTSLQLRNKISEDRIYYIPQYHGNVDDVKDYENRRNVFDGNAWWIHFGSLSSGIGGALRDDQNRPLSKRKIMPPQDEGLPESWCDQTSELAKMEWERRVACWSTFYETRDPNELVEFAEVYKKAIDNLIVSFRLNRKRILRRQQIYSTLGL